MLHGEDITLMYKKKPSCITTHGNSAHFHEHTHSEEVKAEAEAETVVTSPQLVSFSS